jgi:hypothetical protein
MSRFVLQTTFTKVYIFQFLINIFMKNKNSKLYFWDRVTILNVSFFSILST